jgi:hypothetical protein
MISKRIFPTSWFRDYPTASLLDVHSRGWDRHQMQKVAASGYLMQVDLVPEKGHSFVHIITTGAGEYYGSNSNSDFFNEKEGAFEIPCNKDTGRPSTYQMAGGLKAFHQTFTKYGAVYREHNNSKKGGTSQGSIFAEAYNPEMHRGELIIKLANDRWADDLEKLANGLPVTWSMGAGVPFDVCSRCQNVARTRQEYCDHLKYNKLAIDKEGHQTFAINDQPHFHDISRVAVPADRIAFALRKVASAGSVDFAENEQASKCLWLPLSVISKIGSEKEKARAQLLHKLAEIEKKIQVQGLSSDQQDLTSAFGSALDEETLKELTRHPIGDTLGALKKKSVLLPPEGFVRIAMKKPSGDIPGLDGIGEALKSVFTDLEGSCQEEACSDASYEPSDNESCSGLRDKAEKLVPELSIEDEPVRKRVIVAVIRGGPSLGKRASMLVKPTMSAESGVLAREYAKYQLSFLAGAAGADKYAHRVVVHNQVG